MFKYVFTFGAALLASIGLLTPHIQKRREALKTSDCLKCNEGMGRLQQSNKGKYSYKCDHCGSTWVERR
tara:strand:+ start:1698 stop:1904 length:207 start_codon:yes stop_codon:yes gene_type:complete